MKEGNFFKKKIENVTKKILKVAIPIVGMATLPNTLNAQAPKENKPIYTSDKSKADAYKDSLDNYNYGVSQKNMYNARVNQIKNMPDVKITSDPYDTTWVGAKAAVKNGEVIARMHPHKPENPEKPGEIFTDLNRKEQTPLMYYHVEGSESIPWGEYPVFKKPVQPVLYAEKPHLNPKINDYNDMMLIYNYNEARNEASKHFTTDDDNFNWEKNYSVKHDDYIAAQKRLRANGKEYSPVSEERIDYPNINHLQDFSTFYKYEKPKDLLDTKGYSSSDIKKVDQFLNTSRLPSTIPFLNGKQEEGKWNTKYYAVTFTDDKKYMLTEEEFEFLTNKF